MYGEDRRTIAISSARESIATVGRGRNGRRGAMDRPGASWESRLRSRLTTIRVGLELLIRNPELCASPDGPARLAIEAVDQLSEDLAELARAGGLRPGE